MKKIIQTTLLFILFKIGILAQIPTIVKNININDQSAYPGSFPEFITSFNGNVCFTAITNPLNSSTYAFYKSDGTESGTSIIKNIRAFSQSNDQKSFLIFNNELYFTVNNNQLWKSDGSVAGTVQLKTHTNSIFGLFEANGFILYAADGLWRTDGTTSGTINLTPPSLTNFQTNFVKFGNKYYFSGTDALNGNELWKTDGTLAGTVLFKDIIAGTSNSNPSQFFVFNSNLYFFTWQGLWKTDGTELGTLSIKSNISISGLTKNRFIRELNGNFYFRASIYNPNTSIQDEELWKSDGTEQGTVLIKDINAGPASSNIKNIFVANGNLYFFATTTSNGKELWKSDGTALGTLLVKDIYQGFNSGVENSNILFNQIFIESNILYFSATNGTNGYELWKSDGTELGTVMVADINPGAGSSTPDGFEKNNNSLYFSADNGVNGRELWKMSLVPEPTVYINSTPILSNFAGQGETNVPFYIFSLESKYASSTLNQINLRTAGSYLQSDILNFKLFKNNTPNLIGAQQIANLTPTMGVPEVLNFLINENLAANSAVYFIATADISPNAYLSPSPNELETNAHVKSTIAANPLTLFFAGQAPSIVDNQPYNQNISFEQKYELTKGFYVKNPQFTIDGTATTTTISSKAYVSLVQNGAIFKTVEIINGSYNLGSVYDGIYDLVLHKTPSGSISPQLPDGFTSFTAERLGTGPADAIADGKFRVQISGDILSPARVSSIESVIFELAATPLPVNLLTFTAKPQENQIQLNWRTSAETNFSHFEIQKSGNGKEFGAIGKVESRNSGYYNFTDTNPTEGTNYYKLKMIDLDGTSTFSKTISINFEKNGHYLSVENPAKNGELLVRSNYLNPHFTLLNSSGYKMVISITELPDNQHKIKAISINSGIYFLMVDAEGKSETKKIVFE